ncbi:hypothetical protein OG474_00570 [Kribbella sp. NBC_01505]|uniref:hypothetical protein n=1 Tax=Kribbella sp. NBC_01505 TaxID=2903580 RepID=UPI00386B49C1
MLPSSYDRARQAGSSQCHAVPDALPVRLFQLGGGLSQEAAGDDELLDLLGAFEDVEDLVPARASKPDRTPISSSDLHLCAHPFSTLIVTYQHPTEQ